MLNEDFEILQDEETDQASNDSVGDESLPSEKHPLDELSDQQLIDTVHDIEMEYKHLQLENLIFMEFLEDNDPSALEGLEALCTFAIGVVVKKIPMAFLPDLTVTEDGASIDGASTTRSTASQRRSVRFDSYTSITCLADGKGPKINISHKSDMIIKAMEEKQSALEMLEKKAHRTKRTLKAELEEFSIRESDIKEARDIFEYNIVTQGIDKLTQRIPAEKFVRYMEEWLKSAQLNIEKLRLRTASMKLQYKKVSAILVQRQELGGNVHAVDFDQLEIENKHFLEKIEQKNIHLLELKKMNGGANLVLSKHMKYLQKQQTDYNKVKAEIVEHDKNIAATEIEYEKAMQELNKAKDRYDYFLNIKNTYKVPDVMEYLKIKSELADLKKEIKVWQRRKKIQDITLNACIRQMKNLTGRTKVDMAWFEDIGEDSISKTSLKTQ